MVRETLAGRLAIAGSSLVICLAGGLATQETYFPLFAGGGSLADARSTHSASSFRDDFGDAAQSDGLSSQARNWHSTTNALDGLSAGRGSKFGSLGSLEFSDVEASIADLGHGSLSNYRFSDLSGREVVGRERERSADQLSHSNPKIYVSADFAAVATGSGSSNAQPSSVATPTPLVVYGPVEDFTNKSMNVLGQDFQTNLSGF